MENIKRVHLPLFLTNLFYGINFTFAKLVTPLHIQPYALVLIRILGAGFLFLMLFLFLKKQKVEKKDLPLFLFCSLFGVVINQLLFIKGLSLTTPIHAALIMVTTPILVMIISRILSKEDISLTKTIGIILALVGAVLLIAFGKEIGTGVNTLLGDLCIFLNATSYAVYLVKAKPLTKKYDPITVVTYLFSIALPFVLIVGSYQLTLVEWNTIPWKVYICLASVVIGATFLAYLLNNYALQYTSPPVVGAYIYLQPFIAAVMAIFIAHEPITWVKIVSGICIFIGIYMVNKSSEIKTLK